MEVPRTFVITSEPYYWCLKPFAYLFNQFFGRDFPVVIVGYRPIEFELPPNFRFHSISRAPYPQTRWSDALIEFLNQVTDDVFILMLEDYFLVRDVDLYGIALLREHMRENPKILKADLTADRLYARGDARNAEEYRSIGYLDVIKTTGNISYKMSLQCSLWNRANMLSLIHPDMTPWEVELYPQVPDDMLVLGTRQIPMRYANIVYKGKIDNQQVDMIPEPHRAFVKGHIPVNWNVPIERHVP